MLEQLTANFAGNVRREILDGREYLVAPLTMLVPGVLNGSQGPLFYPPQEVIKNPLSWNGMPIVVNHPVDGAGNPVSARSPEVLRKYGIGTVFNAFAKDKLGGEAWFDVKKTKEVVPEILKELSAGRPLEVSTGLFTENEMVDNGEYNGTKYVAVARNYQPDHLAVLPKTKGACSVKDGCGVNVNQRKEDKPPEANDEDLEPYIDWDAENKPTQNQTKKWWELVTNAKPSKGLSSAKACKILKDGAVNGKKLTSKQRRMFGAACGQTQNTESNMPLTNEQREELVTALISNEGFETSPWDEEDREGLLMLNDQKLLALNSQRELALAMLNEEVDDEDGDEDELPAVPQKKKKKMTANDGKKGSCACGHAVTNSEPPRKKTTQQWLADAPEEVRQAVTNALEFQNARKQELINKIVRNERNTLSKEYLNNRSLEELQGIAALAVNQEEEQERPYNVLMPNYAGIPGNFALNMSEDFANEDREMVPE